MTYVLHQDEPLRVGDDLRGVQSLLEVLDELLLVAAELRDLGTPQLLAGTGTLRLERRQAAGEDGLADERHGLAHVESVDGRPLARALLACRVEDLLDERGAVVVVEVEDVAGDFDEERVEDALVPLGEDVGDVLVVHLEAALHDVVGLGQGSAQRREASCSACDAPRKSAACHRTRSRCAPSSRSARHPRRRPTGSRARRRTWRRCSAAHP